MPHLSTLTLSHFRSWRRAQLPFDGRIVAIHGANGAGKTNLIEAISLLSPGRGLRRGSAEEFARRPEALGWKIAAELDSGQELETSAEPGASRAVRIGGKAAPQVALASELRMLWLVPSMDRLFIEGAEGRRRFLDRAAMSFEPAHAEATLAYDKAMRERNRLLKDMVRDAHWYEALEGQMAAAGARIQAGRARTISALMAAQNAAETAFPAATLSLIHPEAGPQGSDEGLRRLFAEGRRRDMAAGRTLDGPHRADLAAIWAEKAMPAADCSTGEQKALLISLILANARALAADGPAPLLLLDEVAAHLDAARRAALYDEIHALGAQAFLTGTGPELFDELGERALRLQITEEEGESHAHRH
ncbi:DNA replication/repair protein RecF [Pseudoroseicyclus tamaricis]|uniref:DNA replication and repair protein RecF n=1 Tax=Pseudoroseicyclus tamaricis TaxID=2705421 RepID=A0A6B2JNG8_9RHOB|nr:DNA replication/repair protein RecF [Pseudoroseicyclus tamaricis]NDU99577.1 DNA replication/repair protein RecF [Pseudoroseicyclus tamaricis]